ncbi:MAG: DNA polymerase I, partial [Clostridiales bacterium]|nr:DNA polymerase I [Clostridiales bacterium]
KDGRIHAHFQQTVAATGRLSCTEPNLQNIPVRYEIGRQLRKAFVAEEGHTLIGADYSQIELRIMAHLSGDENLIGAFNSGEDIHRKTAARVFNIDYDKVTSLDRSRAKAVNFGVIYGMSSFGLSEELHITRKDAESYIAEYFEKHEAVKKYLDDQVKSGKEKGYSLTLCGRRRYIPEINSSNYMTRQFGERLAMNSPIQGSAAAIIKIAMNDVFSELKEKQMRSRLILQIHDELIINAVDDELDAVKELLVRNMENAMKLKVNLTCDLNTGKTWYDLKD